MTHPARIAIAGDIEAALRTQREPVADMSGAHRQEHVAAGGDVDLSLIEGRRAALVPRRLRRAQRTGAAAVLHLVAAEEQELRTNRAGDLRRGLEGDVLELGSVGIAVQRVERAVGAAIGSPRPPLVFDDRGSDIEARIGEVLDAITLARRAR